MIYFRFSICWCCWKKLNALVSGLSQSKCKLLENVIQKSNLWNANLAPTCEKIHLRSIFEPKVLNIPKLMLVLHRRILWFGFVYLKIQKWIVHKPLSLKYLSNYATLINILQITFYHLSLPIIKVCSCLHFIFCKFAASKSQRLI